LNLHRQPSGGEAFVAAARERMRNGDCAGALDAFDLALRSSVDPTLNRDRGLCQEKLGNPYPAIDDYRVYLTASPDAADAEGIRQRLARLEMDVYHHSSESTDAPGGAASSPSGASPATSSSGGPHTSIDDDKPPSAAADIGPEPGVDRMDYVEHDHDELSSSMRAGKGFGLAPFFSEHKWVTSGSSFGDADTWSEAVGLQVRYSFSRSSAFFLQGGWELFNSTSTSASAGTISGLTSEIGYELRVPFDYRYNNQFLLGLGLGFEYLVYTPTNVSTSGTSAGVFVPEVTFGWRHMITTSVGLDLSLGAGITGRALATSSSFLEGSGSGSSPPVEILAANVGVVWGL
jgi:hypothetical protein